MKNNLQKELWRERASLKEMRSTMDPADTKGLKNKYIDLTHKTCLEREINFSAKDRVLDFGCGTGRLSSWLGDFKIGEVVGIDLSPEMIDSAKKRYPASENIKFLIYNGSKIPFPDNYFDKIFSTWVLQHIVDEGQFKEIIRGLNRVLKKDGQIIFIEQTMQKSYLEKYPQTNVIYKVQRSPQDYIKILRENGFDLVKWYPINYRRGIFYKIISVYFPSFLDILINLLVKIDLFSTRWMGASKDKYTDSLFIFKKL